jgi:cobalt-zinc-cadmium efflux system outer membrane protein
LTCRYRVRKMKRLEHDFLNAESEYRTVQLSYVNLIGSYLTAAGRLNVAVGREMIP